MMTSPSYPFLLVCLFLFCVFPAYIYAQTTITFDDQGWADEENIGASVTLSGYTFSATEGGSGFSMKVDNGNAASGLALVANNVNFTAGDILKVVKSGGGNFDINSFHISGTGFLGQMTVRGYFGGGAAIITQSTASPVDGTFTLTDPLWNSVDEVQIESVSGGFGLLVNFDDFSLAAVASDTDAPVFDVAPATSSVTASAFTVGASIDEGGDIYYVVVADGATAPTSANVIAGQANGGGAAIKSGNGTSLADPFTLSSAVTGLAAGTAYDVYVVARDDEGTPNVQASATKVDVTTLAPSSLQVAATVFLEGAWNGTNAMNTTLEDADLVSASAPYNGTNSHTGSESVASAASVPDGAVDWVLVELRESGSAAGATNATRKGSAAGFLMSDGTIKATDGSSNLTISLTGNTGTDYYVVIYHRNHLPIMSANAIAGSSGTLTIDFTTNSANTYQTTTALVSLAGSKFGMPAGDSNGDGSINTTDLGTWRTNNGATYSYSGNGVSDFNLDGEVNAVDRNDFQQKNMSKTRQVPST